MIARRFPEDSIVWRVLRLPTFCHSYIDRIIICPMDCKAERHQASPAKLEFDIEKDAARSPQALTKSIDFTDGISLVLGALIGAGFFVTPGLMFEMVGPMGAVSVWILGSLIALAGALCYSELATFLVSAGSESTYLSKAFGEVAGFSYALMLFLVVGTGGVAAVSNVSAAYIVNGIGFDSAVNTTMVQIVSIALVVALALLNIGGTSHAVILQRVLLVAKIITVVGVLGAAVIHRFLAPELESALEVNFIDGFAMSRLVDGFIAVLFAFNGFQFLAPMTEEMLNPSRDVPRVFFFGITSVTVLGVVVIVAFLSAMSPLTARASGKEIAAIFFQEIGSTPLRLTSSVLIALCAAGSANFKLIGCSRIFYGSARDDGFLPSSFTYISSRNVPVVSIVVTATWTVLIQVAVPNLSDILKYFMTGQILVFALTGMALMRLRATMPNAPRAYKVSLYPITPIVFVGSCLAIIFYSISFSPSPNTARWSLAFAFAGVPLYYIVRFIRKAFNSKPTTTAATANTTDD